MKNYRLLGMLFMCIQRHSYLLAFQTDVLAIFFGVQAQQRRCADSKPGSKLSCLSLALFVEFWSGLAVQKILAGKSAQVSVNQLGQRILH